MADNYVQDFLVKNVTATNALKKNLDAQATRQRAHAQNIANAETPGYRRIAVDFEEYLQESVEGRGSGSLARTDSRHLSGAHSSSLDDLEPVVREELPPPDSPGVNGVDIDLEMAEMAETQLRYLASIELLKRRYSGLKSAIKGQ